MKRNFYILIALSCFFCNAYHNDERNSLDEKEMLRLMHLQESLYAEQDTISFPLMKPFLLMDRLTICLIFL